MDSKDRLKKAVDYLKTIHSSLTNDAISLALRYRSQSYVSDLLGGSKPISDLFLSRLEHEYSISSKWIRSGGGEMLIKNNAEDTPEVNSGDPLLRPLELGDINVTVADYIRLQDEFRKVQGDFLQSLLQKNEVNSTSLDVQLGELMKTMRIDHSQILKALDKVLALPPGSLSKETDKIKDAVDKKLKERSNVKD